MKLFSYLNTLGEDGLRSIAIRIGVPVSCPSRLEIQREIHSRLKNRSHLQSILQNLPEPALGFLRLLVQQDAVQHEVYAPVSTDGYDVLDELASHGLVTREGDVYNRKCRIFEDLYKPIREILTSLMTSEGPGFQIPSVIYSYPKVLANDLITLLGYIDRNQISLLDNRRVPVEYRQELEQLLWFSRLSQVYKEFTHCSPDWGKDYVDILYNLRLIELKGNQLVAQADSFERLLDIVEQARRSPIIYLRRYPEGQKPDPILQAFEDVIHGMNRHADNQWQSVEDLLRGIHLFGENRNRPSNDTWILNRLFLLMLGGSIDLGEINGHWFWRIHPEENLQPMDSTQLTVRPDFMIMGPSEMNLADRCFLEKIADTVTVDAMMQWRITRDSIYRGLCKGISVEEQINWLKDHTYDHHPLPEKIRTTIQRVGQQFGRMGIERVELIICDSPETAREISLRPDLKGYILGKLSDRILLVKQENYQSLHEILRKLEYFPAPGLGDGTRWLIQE